MLSFLSDSMGEKTFFRTEYEYKDNTYIFSDKSVKSTRIYLTINEDSILFERKGDINMHLLLRMNEKTPGFYESTNGLSFMFQALTTCIEITKNKIHMEYDLFVNSDMVSKQKIWISF